MQASHAIQRLGYIFLCSGPFFVIGLVGIRALRVPGVHELIGGIVVAAFVIATGAVAMGMEVVMFFTFWGTSVLRDKKKKVFAGRFRST